VGPFLAAVAAFALSTGGFLSAFLAILIFAATMGSLMLVVSLLVGVSSNTNSLKWRRIWRHPSISSERAVQNMMPSGGIGIRLPSGGYGFPAGQFSGWRVSC
jgi:hypothetical protein